MLLAGPESGVALNAFLAIGPVKIGVVRHGGLEPTKGAGDFHRFVDFPMRHGPSVGTKEAGDVIRKPISVTNPLSLKEHEPIDFVGRVIRSGRKQFSEFFDKFRSEFLIGIEPKDPWLGGQFEVVIPDSGKAFPGSGLNVRAEVFGNLDGVIGAPGVENQAFCEGVELAEAARKVSGFIKAEYADCDGKAVAHFEVFWETSLLRSSTAFVRFCSILCAEARAMGASGFGVLVSQF